MGSLEAACIHGFLCRLCSQMHRIVVHIYAENSDDLADKINEFLPVTVTRTDPLPKTICKTCLKRVESHHKLIKTIEKNHIIFEAHIAQQHAALANSNRNSQTENNTDNNVISETVTEIANNETETGTNQMNEGADNENVYI